MKKGLSFIIACTLMLTSILSLFSGCSINAEATDKMLISEWLYLINQSFGFNGYSTDEPYISSITADNPSFADVQTAFEYSVLPEGYTNLNLDDELTREFCALTLAGAIYIPNTNEVSIADKDDLNFPESVTTVINEGIMSLDEKGKFNPKDKMGYGDAVTAIENAYDSWVNHRFEHQFSFSLSEDAIDFAGLSTVDQTNESGNYSVDSSYVKQQQNWLDDNHFTYDDTTGIVTIDNVDEKGIKEGSILVLPESLEHPAGLYIKVTKIDENTDTDSNKYTLATEIAELDEIFPDGYKYQGVDTADFTQAVIYDADGNILSAGRFADNSITAEPMLYNYNSYDVTAMPMTYNVLTSSMSDNAKKSSQQVPITIKLPTKSGDKLEMTLTPAMGSLSSSIKYEKDGTSLTFEKKFENFEVVNKVSKDITDYMKLGMSFKTTDSFTYKHTMTKKDKNIGTKSTSGIDYNNEYVQNSLSALGGIMDDIGNYIGEDIDVSPTVARISLPIAPGLSVDMLVKIRFKLEGTIEVALTYAGQEIGIEKREWKLSLNVFNWKTPLPTAYYNKGTQTNTSVSGALKAELTFGLNFAACIASINIMDIEPAIGVGAKMSGKLNYVNELKQPLIDEVLLNQYAIEAITAADLLTDVWNIGGNVGTAVVDIAMGETNKFMACFDTTIYPIAKITACTGDSIVGKYITSISKEFFNSKSTPLFESHAEWDSTGFHWQKCTLSDIIDDGIERGDNLEFSPMADAIMDVDDVLVYSITMLPETKKKVYTLSDLVIEAVDETTGEKVANVLIKNEFNNNGVESSVGDGVGFFLKNLFTKPIKDNIDKKEVKLEENQFSITAISPGNTNVIIRTRDNLFKTGLNIHVNEPSESANTTIMLMTYSASVALNDSLQLSMTAIPNGKDETSVFWQCDNEEIASIDPLTGEITGVSEGTCTVVAYIPGFEDSATYCSITVTKDYTSTGIVYFNPDDPDLSLNADTPPVMEYQTV